MKYKFVYDTGFLEKNSFCLSAEEVRVVLATVLGHHNAIFWGYKPERLAKAVSHLSNNNILMLYDVGMEAQIHLNNWSDTDRQYILVEPTPPYSSVICGLVKKTSIVYKCKEKTGDYITTSTLKERIEGCKHERMWWQSTQHVQGKLPIPNRIWFTPSCWELYKQFELVNRQEAIKFAAVARSLSDVDCICEAEAFHFIEAIKYYNTGSSLNEEQNNEI